MKVSLCSGLLGVDTSYFSSQPLKRFIQPTKHQLEENIHRIKWHEHTSKLKLQPPNQLWPTFSEALFIFIFSLSSVSFFFLGKFLVFIIFPNHSAPGTYTAQTFTVNSKSRTVRLSGAVTVTSNFGNTRTKNEKKKTQYWHIVNLQGLLKWKRKWGFIISASHRWSGISERECWSCREVAWPVKAY